jgi:hypothetical protein
MVDNLFVVQYCGNCMGWTKKLSLICFVDMVTPMNGIY